MTWLVNKNNPAAKSPPPSKKVRKSSDGLRFMESFGFRTSMAVAQSAATRIDRIVSWDRGFWLGSIFAWIVFNFYRLVPSVI